MEAQKFMKDSRVKKIIYTYDSRNRLSGVRYENGMLMTYRYDPAGNLVGCTVSSQAEALATDTSSPSSPQPVHTPDRKVSCSRCGNMVAPGKKFCSNCGAPVSEPAPADSATQQSPSVCPACSTPLKAGAKFCGNCGAKIN